MNLLTSNSLRYRAYIDGLRAIAVIAVLLYHANIGISGGYVGVDIFFVISGYLITSLILKDLNNDNFKIINFWERRIVRILPALLVIILSCLIIGWFLFLPNDFNNLAKSVTAQMMLVSNIFFYREINYFAPNVDKLPLIHTWSLAVEEQFYLIFPLMLIAIYKYSRKHLIPVIILLSSFSFFISVYWSYKYPGSCFYLLPSRTWELLIGSFLASIPEKQITKPHVTEILSWGGFIAILCSMLLYNNTTKFPGISALLPCIGTALVIWSNNNNLTKVGKFLSLRPIVFIGLISYSLYLWHWPILVIAKYYMPISNPPIIRILMLIVSMLIAILSWKFVETPFRKRILFKSTLQIFTFAGIATVILLFASISIKKFQGFPARFPTSALQYEKGSTDRAFLNQLILKDALTGNFIEIGLKDKSLPVDIFVWGDSHAMAVMPIIDILCKEYSIRGLAATHSSTMPLIGYKCSYETSLKQDCIPYNNAVVNYINKNHVKNVMMVGKWSDYVLNDDHDNTEITRSCLINTINAFKDSDVKIWIMRQVPESDWDVPFILASSVVYHHSIAEKIGIPKIKYKEANNIQNQIFNGLSTKFTRVNILDPTYLFMGSDNTYRVEKNGKSLYSDKQHLSIAGAIELRPLFEPIFRKEIQKNTFIQSR